MSNNDTRTETIIQNQQRQPDFHFTHEFLDAITGLLLEVMEEINDRQFSRIILSVLQAFDGETIISLSDVKDLEQKLKLFQPEIGLNTYCLLMALLSFHTRRIERMWRWLDLIAHNSVSGTDFEIYKLLRLK